MNPDDILKSLGTSHPYGKTTVSVTPEHYDSADALEARIGELTGPQGWIARQSGVDVFRADHTQKGATLGPVLSGELADGDMSLHITRLPQGWTVAVITQGVGDPCLFDVVKHLTVHHGAAVYHRFWILPPDGAADVFAWRFVGFEKVET